MFFNENAKATKDSPEKLQAIADFIAQRLATIDGVTSTRSHFMLKPYKKDGVIINDEERDRRLVVSP